jgi:hypothetical protein
MPLFIPQQLKKQQMKKFLKDYDARSLFGVALILAMMATIISMVILNQY